MVRNIPLVLLHFTLFIILLIAVYIKPAIYFITSQRVSLHTGQTWPLKVWDHSRFEVFHHWCLKSIMYVKWQQILWNEEARTRLFGIEPQSATLIQLIRIEQLRWLGHIGRIQLSGWGANKWLITLKDLVSFSIQCHYCWKSLTEMLAVDEASC